MQALWRDDVACVRRRVRATSRRRGRGRSRRSRAGRRCSSAARPGPKLFAHIAEYADGWIPIGGAGVRAALPELHARVRSARSRPADAADRAVRHGSRRRASSSTTRRSASTEVVLRLPAAVADRVLPVLDRYAELVGSDDCARARRARRVGIAARRGARPGSRSTTRRRERSCDRVGPHAASASRALASPVDAWRAYRPARPMIDGLPTRVDAPSAPVRAHRSSTRTARRSIDHVVVFSVDDARTIDAFVDRRLRGAARARGRAARVCARRSSARAKSIIELVRADRPRPPADPQPAVLRHRVHRRRSRRVR